MSSNKVVLSHDLVVVLAGLKLDIEPEKIWWQNSLIDQQPVQNGRPKAIADRGYHELCLSLQPPISHKMTKVDITLLYSSTLEEVAKTTDKPTIQTKYDMIILKKNGSTGLFSVKINELSSSHQHQKFILKFEVGSSDVLPFYTEPIESKSKETKSNKRTVCSGEFLSLATSTSRNISESIIIPDVSLEEQNVALWESNVNRPPGDDSGIVDFFCEIFEVQEPELFSPETFLDLADTDGKEDLYSLTHPTHVLLSDSIETSPLPDIPGTTTEFGTYVNSNEVQDACSPRILQSYISYLFTTVARGLSGTFPSLIDKRTTRLLKVKDRKVWPKFIKDLYYRVPRSQGMVLHAAIEKLVSCRGDKCLMDLCEGRLRFSDEQYILHVVDAARSIDRDFSQNSNNTSTS